MKGLSQSGTFPSGNRRYYLKQPGRQAVPMPDLPRDDPAFLTAYTRAIAGETDAQDRAPATGTIAAGILAYLKSDRFLAYSAATRQLRRRALQDMRQRYGRARLRDLAPRHIREDLAQMAPNPANNRLKAWRALCAFWVECEWLESDPAALVKPRKTRIVGHTAWTRDDLAAFRRRWPVGTQQRLACELIYQTAAAIKDACNLGPGNVRDGWCTYTRAKTSTIATAPFTPETSPAWYEPSLDLAECIRQAPRHLTYLSTRGGASRSSKAAGSWFSKACQAAGLEEGKTAHGLRKLRSIVMAENGATPDQRQRVMGHDSTAQTLEYSATADGRRIISGTNFSNSHDQVGNKA